MSEWCLYSVLSLVVVYLRLTYTCRETGCGSRSYFICSLFTRRATALISCFLRKQCCVASLSLSLSFLFAFVYCRLSFANANCACVFVLICTDIPLKVMAVCILLEIWQLQGRNFFFFRLVICALLNANRCILE